MNQPGDGAARPLSPGQRLLAMVAAYGLLTLAGPGALSPDGAPALGVLALALWSAAAARPGRFAAGVEWFGAALGFAAQMEWIRHVAPGALPPTAGAMALFAVLGGPMLRRLVVAGVPFPLAVAAVWTALETARGWHPPPLGNGWLQLGHLAAAWPAFLGGARLFGLTGLTFALAALGGLAGGLARLLEARRRGEVEGGRALWLRLRVDVPLGVGPALLLALGAALWPAPSERPGPLLLLVQPNIAQSVKMELRTAQEFLDAQVEATAAGLAAMAAAGAPAPDLVVWAETMLPLEIVDSRARGALDQGIGFPPWRGSDSPERLRAADGVERAVVEGGLFGRGRVRGGLLPEGTAFLAGLEIWTERGGFLRRQNGAALWDPDHTEPRQLAAKRFLVPGAEGMAGLERFDWVRRWISPVAGYVPDFVPAERTEVLSVGAADGERFRMAVQVCFDNAFQAAFRDPLALEPVDFHAVLSNEAWYLSSYELDQMIAFSKVAAAATGRAVVRATNSGITCLIGPDGRERARLRVAGRDRLVAGALPVRVPVPADGRVPPAVSLEPAARWAGLGLAPLLLLFWGRNRTRRRG